MSFDFETLSSDEAFKSRYKAIEAANAKSVYLNNVNRAFDAYQSINSIGDSRERPDKTTAAARRVIAGGNMSPLGTYGPKELSEEERKQDAKENMARFFASIGIDKTSVYLLNPERDYSTPLTVVNVDNQAISSDTEWPVRLDASGDFIYTRDPNKILAVRPADCPVMIAAGDTPQGKIYALVHYAWKGAAHHYVQQTAKIFDELGIDKESLEIYLTPGAQAENFAYTNYPRNPLEEFPGTEGLFVAPRSHLNDEGAEVWDFTIDTPKFVYDQVLKYLAVDSTQVFCDTSDTAALDSGYSSQTRSVNLREHNESNTRDMVVAVYDPRSSE